MRMRSTVEEIMADREFNVYQAKLAEQAERYDGRDRAVAELCEMSS